MFKIPMSKKLWEIVDQGKRLQGGKNNSIFRYRIKGRSMNDKKHINNKFLIILWNMSIIELIT